MFFGHDRQKYTLAYHLVLVTYVTTIASKAAAASPFPSTLEKYSQFTKVQSYSAGYDDDDKEKNDKNDQKQKTDLSSFSSSTTAASLISSDKGFFGSGLSLSNNNNNNDIYRIAIGDFKYPPPNGQKGRIQVFDFDGIQIGNDIVGKPLLLVSSNQSNKQNDHNDILVRNGERGFFDYESAYENNFDLYTKGEGCGYHVTLSNDGKHVGFGCEHDIYQNRPFKVYYEEENNNNNDDDNVRISWKQRGSDIRVGNTAVNDYVGGTTSSSFGQTIVVGNVDGGHNETSYEGEVKLFRWKMNTKNNVNDSSSSSSGDWIEIDSIFGEKQGQGLGYSCVISGNALIAACSSKSLDYIQIYSIHQDDDIKNNETHNHQSLMNPIASPLKPTMETFKDPNFSKAKHGHGRASVNYFVNPGRHILSLNYNGTILSVMHDEYITVYEQHYNNDLDLDHDEQAAQQEGQGSQSQSRSGETANNNYPYKYKRLGRRIVNRSYSTSLVGSHLSMSADGYTIAVGNSYFDDLRGFVAVYDYDPFWGTWEESFYLRGSEKAQFVGFSVDITGDSLFLAFKYDQEVLLYERENLLLKKQEEEKETSDSPSSTVAMSSSPTTGSPTSSPPTTDSPTTSPLSSYIRTTSPPTAIASLSSKPRDAGINLQIEFDASSSSSSSYSVGKQYRSPIVYFYVVPTFVTIMFWCL